MPHANLELLGQIAKRLGSLLSEVVFVGGCTTSLLVSDDAVAGVRPTFDVDVIAEIRSYAEYANFSKRLRMLGFQEDTSRGAPLCRWLIDELKLDVMPLKEEILGFTNRWYQPAMNAAKEMELEGGIQIRVVTAPYFIATKLDAFHGRGLQDYANSHDLEDLLTVIDGREAIVEEIAETALVRTYIAGQFRGLLEIRDFVDALPGYLLPDPASQERLPILEDRIKRIAAFH